MLDAAAVKDIALGLGAADCGIAPAARFGGAPAGFRPADIDPSCRSVVVFLKEIPAQVLRLDNPVPHTHAAALLYRDLDRIGLDLCRALEQAGHRAVPVPSDTPYLHWEADRRHGMGLLSLRHAAALAGLGVLGRSTLLLHPRLGNRTYLGAVLTDADLPGDPVVTDPGCPDDCRACLDACPVQALDGTTVDQARCRSHAGAVTARGFELYVCCRCRGECPRLAG